MKLDYNNLAESYAKYRQVHPEVFKALASGSGANRDSKVLEVGCGTGNYIIALREKTGCRARGIDPSEKMLEKAKSRGAPVEFSPGRAEEPGLEGPQFDFIFTVDVVHFVKDREAYYRKAFGLLNDGGRICTVTDCEEIIMSRKPLTNYFPETVPFELERYPKDGEIQDIMWNTGFNDIHEEKVFFEKDVTDISLWKNKASSTLNLIPEEAFQRGIARMEEDLKKGPIKWVSPYLLIWGKK